MKNQRKTPLKFEKNYNYVFLLYLQKRILLESKTKPKKLVLKN